MTTTAAPAEQKTRRRFQIVDDPEQVADALAIMRAAQPARFDKVHRWYWAQFDRKPPADVRAAIMAAGWNWCPKKLWHGQRGAWALATVAAARDKRRPSIEDLQARHGSEPVRVYDEDEDARRSRQSAPAPTAGLFG